MNSCPICQVNVFGGVSGMYTHIATFHRCSNQGCPLIYHYNPNYWCMYWQQIQCNCVECGMQFNSAYELMEHYYYHLECRQYYGPYYGYNQNHNPTPVDMQNAYGLAPIHQNIAYGHPPIPDNAVYEHPSEAQPAYNDTDQHGGGEIDDESDMEIDVDDDHMSVESGNVEIPSPRNDDGQQPGPSSHEDIDVTENADILQQARIAYRAMRDKTCHLCANSVFNSVPELQKHIFLEHREHAEASWDHPHVENPLQLELQRRVFHDAYTIYEVKFNKADYFDINGLFNGLQRQVLQVLNDEYTRLKVYRVQFDMNLHMFRTEDANVIDHFPDMQSFQFLIENEFSAMYAFQKTRDDFNVRLEDYIQLGSGWILDRINNFRIIISKMDRFYGGGGAVGIDLPYALHFKRYSLLNPPGTDNLCFKRAVLAHNDIKGHLANGDKHKLQTLKFYKPFMEKDDIIDWTGIKFPFDIKQAKKFEAQNPTIALNIYLYDEEPEEVKIKEINVVDVDSDDENEELDHSMVIYNMIRSNTHPIYICKENKPIIIDLLLVMNGEQQHFCLITNFTRFLKNPQYSGLQGICRFCLQSFTKSFDHHATMCNGAQRTDFPTKNSFRFNLWKNTIKAPFIFLADFEAGMEKVSHPQRLHKHKANGYMWVCIDYMGRIEDHETYIRTDENESVAERLIGGLLAKTEELRKRIKDWNVIANNMAGTILLPHQLPTEPVECGFCKKLTQPADVVRHHSHLPPFQYEFLSCNSCNLNAKVSKTIPCFFHNLKGYDSHFIIRATSNKRLVTSVEGVGPNPNKFVSLKLNKKLVFMDSLNFFHSSLDSVVKTLGTDDFKITRWYFNRKFNFIKSKVDLLLRKGVYPYSYMDSLEKYDETELPPASAFYDELREKHISPEDYKHAQCVWNELGIKNMREYTEIYVEADVLLLADCFERMRSMFLQEFTLDPAHYYSLPQLSWDCAMKYTGVELDYIKDETMYVFLEGCKRGGMSVGGDIRTAKANNKYLPDYDPKKESSFICYFDINNLYPMGLTTHLPLRDFEWVDEETILRIDENFIKNIPDKGEKGYFFEVDLHFPDHLHDYFSSLTPVPYQRSVDYTELSPLQQHFADNLNIPENTITNSRLITDLHDRKRYKVHYRVLSFYLKLGVQLKHVHSGIRFTQSDYLAKYINRLTYKRQQSTSKVEQNWYKLCNNVIFGKSIEDLRQRSTFIIVRDREQALRLNRKPNIARVMILDPEPGEDDLAIVVLNKTCVKLTKPIYIGVTCLDESKRLYYEFYYNFALPTWGTRGRRIECLGGDTDSQWLFVQTQDVYEDMKKHETKWFDLSDFDKDHPIWGKYHSNLNKKVLGKMKDECANKVISHFVFLKPKMYQYRYCQEGKDMISGQTSYSYKDVKKGKGIGAVALAKQITFEDYVNVVEEPIQLSTESTNIKSFNHTIYTVREKKKGLSGFDVKRYWQPCGIRTIPYGHYSFRYHTLPEVEEEAKFSSDDGEE